MVKHKPYYGPDTVTQPPCNLQVATAAEGKKKNPYAGHALAWRWRCDALCTGPPTYHISIHPVRRQHYPCGSRRAAHHIAEKQFVVAHSQRHLLSHETRGPRGPLAASTTMPAPINETNGPCFCGGWRLVTFALRAIMGSWQCLEISWLLTHVSLLSVVIVLSDLLLPHYIIYKTDILYFQRYNFRPITFDI